MTAGRVTVCAGFVLLVAVLIYLDQGSLLFVVFAAALLHELGHYIPLKLLGGRVARLELTGGGLNMVTSQPLGYGKEILTVLAGPVTSLGFALLFSLWDGMMEEQMPLAGMCLSHGVFNLLPVRELDGGRALELALNAAGCKHTRTVLSVTTAVMVFILAALCGYLAWKTRNLSLALAMIYILTRR
ncbi:MAG: hypothetical protein LBI19_05925 [Oscillospiraceae bacterium]|jgi:stage IV sporulation protein FB|nr:hypothetical protein [Oscillospiraceae bacterium]